MREAGGGRPVRMRGRDRLRVGGLETSIAPMVAVADCEPLSPAIRVIQEQRERRKVISDHTTPS